MTAKEIVLTIDSLISRLSPAYLVTAELLLSVAVEARAVCDDAELAGHESESSYAREAIREVISGGYLRPWTEADHLRARLAGLAYHMSI
jgi:hypothetical protein